MDMANQNKHTISLLLDNNWINKFGGFCDGDGNFQTFPKKRFNLKNKVEASNNSSGPLLKLRVAVTKSSLTSKENNLQQQYTVPSLMAQPSYYNVGYGFHISLSSVDSQLLYSIQENLGGLGHVYVNHHKQEARFAVTKLSELIWLVDNVFDKMMLVTNSQRVRYARFRHGLLNKFNRVETLEHYKDFLNESYLTELSELQNLTLDNNQFKNWFVGFVNSEGNFNITKHKNVFVFSIEHTDENSLMIIKKAFGFTPNVLFRKARSEKRKPTYVLAISSKRDIKLLIKTLLDTSISPLEGNKLNQFNSWYTSYQKALILKNSTLS